VKSISIDRAIEIARENFDNKKAYRKYTGMGWIRATEAFIEKLERLRD